MSNKKVCHISIVHKVNDIRIFHKECVSLATNHYDVTYVYSGEVNQLIDNVNVIGLGHQKLSRMYRYFSANRAIIKRALETKSDIYHIHDPELIRFAKKLKNNCAKVVYDSHEHTPMQVLEKEWIPRILRPFVSKLTDMIEMKNTKYCDLIIAVADKTFERFNNKYDNVIKVENLPIKKEFENIKINYDEKNKANVFCYSGAIWKERGLNHTCFAFEGLDNISLEIAGRIDVENLESYIRNMPDNVTYLEYQPRKIVHELYERSICGLCLFEPYPNNMIDPPTKIFEYMAAGIPTICSNFKSMEDIVVKYQCGISVDPTNINEIREAILYMVNNKEEVKRMGQNGLKAINEQLNWEAHEKVLLDAYRRLL